MVSKRQREAREHARQVLLAQQRGKARRARIAVAGAAVALVVVLLGVLVVVKLNSGSAAQTAPAPTGSAAAAALAAATGVPASVLDQVKAGKVDVAPKAVSGQQLLTDSGKPLVLYVGAEYCPFCAAQRWPMVVALSRFGTFGGLRLTTSSASDVYPNTATLSFYGATYTSDYLRFQGVETTSNVRQGQGYAPLQPLTPQQHQLMSTLNAPPYVPKADAGSIPFIDYANRAVSAGASYSPQLLAGKSADQIAAALSDPASPIAQAVDGEANAITALLCRLTGAQPSQVCGSPAVTAFAGKFDDIPAR